MSKIMDELNIALAIAVKDVADAFKNRATLTNILVLIGMVFFFYWMSTLRPFDKSVDVVVLDQGATNLQLEKTTLSDGSELDFRSAESQADLEKKLAYQHLGLVLPADFDQQLSAGNGIELTGYVRWARRAQVPELESKYSAMFSELLDTPVVVQIGDNILLPTYDALGMASTAAFHVYFAILWMALAVVPFLILEERKAKTMEALLVSPASPGLVVLGKGIAGLILISAIAGLAIVLNRAYIIHWDWALLGFLLSATFAVGLALLLGSLIRSPQHITLWMLPVAFLFVVPGFFTDEPNLTPAAKSVMNWLPAVAFNRILGFSVSDGSDRSVLVFNLAVAIAAIVLVYLIVIWLIRRSDT